jgi:hypothetical protein
MKVSYPFVSSQFITVVLLVLLFFNVLSAIGGGIGMIFPGSVRRDFLLRINIHPLCAPLRSPLLCG